MLSKKLITKEQEGQNEVALEHHFQASERRPERNKIEYRTLAAAAVVASFRCLLRPLFSSPFLRHLRPILSRSMSVCIAQGAGGDGEDRNGSDCDERSSE
jgi:hypothetical protein